MSSRRLALLGWDTTATERPVEELLFDTERAQFSFAGSSAKRVEGFDRITLFDPDDEASPAKATIVFTPDESKDSGGHVVVPKPSVEISTSGQSVTMRASLRCLLGTLDGSDANRSGLRFRMQFDARNAHPPHTARLRVLSLGTADNLFDWDRLDKALAKTWLAAENSALRRHPLADLLGLPVAGSAVIMLRFQPFMDVDPATPASARLLTAVLERRHRIGAPSARTGNVPVSVAGGHLVPCVQRRPLGWGGGSKEGGYRVDASERERWVIDIPGLVAESAVVEVWNGLVVEPYWRSLRMVQSGQALSGVPKLEPQGGPPQVWGLVVQVVDGGWRQHFLRPADLVLAMGAAMPSAECLGDARRLGNVSVAACLEPAPLDESKATPVVAVFGHIRDHLGCSLRLPMGVVRGGTRKDQEEPFADLQFGLVPRTDKTAGVRPASVRVGALDLQFDPRLTPSAADRTDRTSRLGATFHARPQQFAIATLDARIDLPLSSVAPGGQDPLPEDAFVPEEAPGEISLAVDAAERDVESGFRREPPVVIALGPVDGSLLLVDLPAAPEVGVPLWLRLDEKSRPDRNQTLRVRLEEPSDAADRPPPPLVVLFDRHPFLVAAARPPAFRGVTAGEGILEIANWSNADAAGSFWEIRDAKDAVLWLPPQGLGEAHEKTKGDGFDIDEVAGTPPKSGPVDFRLTPVARLTLSPFASSQRFVEPAWNLRRSLGWPGQRSPGARLRDAQFELVYGLATSVSGVDGLLIAEQLANVGRYPIRLPRRLAWRGASHLDNTHHLVARYREHRTAWSHLHRRLHSRLSVLEVWKEGAQRALSEGVSCTLRRSARTRWPILERTSPPEQDVDAAIPVDADGLAGGVTWAFESRNIYRAVWRNPTAVKSLLADLRFSALGGWGHQEATFDNGLSKVYADVAMGRVTRLTLERMGRIAVTWNLAKHVIVYERTVSQNPQFKDDQSGLVGRAVVRKVREYVEILEPTREFPDGSGQPIHRACVESSEAKSKVIDVKGSWGGDVGSIGWRVPLWNPSAGPLYPRPHLAFGLTAAVEGAPRTYAENLQPEKMWFFTLTTPGASSDPHTWPAQHGVDFVDRPSPRPPSHPGLGDGDQRLPDGVSVEPGYDGLTWAVAPSSQPADLVSARADRPMGAVLSNVTLSRGRAFGAPSPAAAVATPYLELLDRVGPHFEDVGRRVAEFLPASGIVSDAQIDAILLRVDGVGAALAADAKLAKDVLLAAQSTATKGREVFRAARSAVDEAVASLRDGATRATAQALRAVDAVRDRLEKAVLDVAPGGVEATKDKFLAAVKGVVRDAKEQTLKVASGIETMLAVATQTRDGSARLVDGAVATLRALATRARDVALADAATVAARVDGLHAAAEVCWAIVASRIGGLETEILASARGVLGEVAYRVRDALRGEAGALADDVAAWRRSLDEGLEGIVRAIRAGEDVVEELESFDERVEDAVLRARGDIVRRLLGSGATPGPLSLALDLLGDARVRAIRETVEKAEALSASLVSTWKDKIEAALEDVAQPAATVLRAVDKVRGDAQKELADALHWLSTGVDSLLADRDTLGRWFGDETADVKRRLERLLAPHVGAVPGVIADVKGALRSAAKEAGALRGALDRVLADARATAGTYADRARDVVHEVLGSIWQGGDEVVRMVRAFGDAPVVSTLAFNRDRIAYFFDEARREVGTTPVAALVDRAGSELKAMGLRVPTTALLDCVIPASLQNFSLSTLFPDFAGLKLSSLFPALRMPGAANDGVRVSHGVDPQSGRGWLEATVDVPVTESATLFAIGPVAIKVPRSRFEAQARVAAALSGETSRRVSGRISADWELHVGSLHLVTFRDTVLRFDETGKVRFDLAPEKVELQGAMKFIGDVVKTTNGPDKGLAVRFVVRGGVPVGVESVVNLPLPDLSFGAVAISHLQFGAALRVLLLPEFRIEVAVNLSRKRAPFSLAIAFLGGGGWLEAATSYAPLTRATQTDVTIGIVAGAQIAFALGPIRGGVYFHFGIYTEFHAGAQGGQGLTIGIMILLRGEAELLGFISISLEILLEARYSDGGRLVGRGSVSISVKIFWFFTFNFSASMEYVLSEGKGGAVALLAMDVDVKTPSQRYLELFEGGV